MEMMMLAKMHLALSPDNHLTTYENVINKQGYVSSGEDDKGRMFGVLSAIENLGSMVSKVAS